MADSSDIAQATAVNRQSDDDGIEFDIEQEIVLDAVDDDRDDTDTRTPVMQETGVDMRQGHAVCGSVSKKMPMKRRLFDSEATDMKNNQIYKKKLNATAVSDDIGGSDSGDDAKHDRRDEEDETVNRLKTRPGVDRFVYCDQIIDLRGPLPGFEGASVIFTNIYNTFVHIVKLKDTLSPMKNRKLTIQLLATEHHLRKLEENNYTDAHVQLPRMVESLFSMWDYRANPVYINQLKPITCVLNKKHIADRITFRSMDAFVKNDSNYIELVFNNPFRFVFVGCAARSGQHNMNIVHPLPFFGEYYNKAIGDMYEVLYEMVSREIRKAKKELAQREQNESGTGEGDRRQTVATDTTVNCHQNSLQSMEAFSNSRQAHGNSSLSQDTERLNSYLRFINLPLAKRDNCDILVTSGNSGRKATDSAKMNYLMVEKGKEAGGSGKGSLKMIETDVIEDAVYLSSYIRCRVIIQDQQPAFVMQIYTRHAVKLMIEDNRLVKFSDFD